MATMTKSPKRRSRGAEEEEPPEHEREGEAPLTIPPKIVREWKKGPGKKGDLPGFVVRVEPDGTLTLYIGAKTDARETGRLINLFCAYWIESPGAVGAAKAGEHFVWDA